MRLFSSTMNAPMLGVTHTMVTTTTTVINTARTLTIPSIAVISVSQNVEIDHQHPSHTAMTRSAGSSNSSPNEPTPTVTHNKARYH